MNILFLTTTETSLLISSLVIAIVTTVTTLVVSAVLAYFLVVLDFPHRQILRRLFLLPLFIPPYLHALTWLNLLQFLSARGLIGIEQVQFIRSTLGVIWILTWSYFPIMFYFLEHGLSSISSETWASTKIYLSQKNAWRKVIIPQIQPAVAVGLALTFIFAFTTFDVPEFLEIKVFPTLIFSQFSTYFNIAHAMKLSATVYVACAVALWLVLRKYWKQGWQNVDATNLEDLGRNKTGPLQLVSGSFTMSFILICSLVLPIGSFILGSSLFTQTFSQDLASSLDVTLQTLYLGTAGSIALVITGVLLAVLLQKLPTVIRILFLATLAIPSISYAIGFIGVFNRPEFRLIYATPLMLVLAYTIRFAPIITEIVLIRYGQIPPSWHQAAQLLIKSRFVRLIAITRPLMQSAIVLAIAIAFWLIVTELPITLLIQPPGMQTLSSRLLILLHYGSTELMNTLTICLLLLSIFPVVLGWQITRKKQITTPLLRWFATRRVVKTA